MPFTESRAVRPISSSARKLSRKAITFRTLTLVGVVDGDLGLSMGADPRAGERTFQLLHQVTGGGGTCLRSRPRIHSGRICRITRDAAMLSGDREEFLAREIEMRQRGLLPPYGRLAAVIISARDKELAERYARDVARRAPSSDRISVLGPAEAPNICRARRHRWRLLVKAPREADIQGYLRAWLSAVPEPKGDLRLSVDVDPYSFL